jgi:hypothetical protein
MVPQPLRSGSDAATQFCQTCTVGSSRVLKIGLLGYGTVGSGVYRMLADNRESIEKKVGFSVEVVLLAVKLAASMAVHLV